MNCKQVENKLIFFIEGELSPTEKEETQEHLKTCSACATKVAFMQDSLLHLDVLKEAEPKPFLYTRIQARKSQANVVRLKPVFAPLAYAAFLAVGLFLGTMVGKMSIPKDQSIDYEVAYLFDDAGLESVESYLID